MMYNVLKSIELTRDQNETEGIITARLLNKGRLENPPIRCQSGVSCYHDYKI